MTGPPPAQEPLPEAILRLVEEREERRRSRDFSRADALRSEIEAEGYLLRDTPAGPVVLPQPTHHPLPIASSRAVPSRLEEPPQHTLSLLLLAENWWSDLERCMQGLWRWCVAYDFEIVAVDNASSDGTGERLDAWAQREPRLRVLHTATPLGEGEGRNVSLKQATGEILVLLDTSIEPVGDFLGPLRRAFDDPTVGLAGPWGVTTADLHTFHDSPGPQVDALLGYCWALRSEAVRRAGLLDERFRYYRNLDLDYSFALRAQGYRAVVVPDLPLLRHEHRGYTSLPEEERERLSRRNFNRFLEKWRDRTDLLVERG